ncbi:MAG: AI-2E family transporter [Planctomycetota bacterium]|nr:MAG: AI-2E family transporter [Planctomycetota bacterium]
MAKPNLNLDAERRIQTVCLMILTAIGVGVSLYLLAPVLIPFVLAVFLVYCLTPIIDVQMRYLRIGRTAALATTVLLGSVVVFLLWLVIWASVSEMSQHTGEYEQELTRLLDDVAARLPLEKLGIERDKLSSAIRISRESAQRVAGSLIGSIMTVFSNGMLVLIFMLFMLAGKHKPPRPGSILEQLETQIKSYLVTKVLVSGATGVLVFIALKLIGVRFALAFGVLTFLLNFIPNIGSVVATLLPLPVVVLNPALGLASKILAIAIPGAIQFVVGNFIEPRMLGKSLNLHPVAVLVGLIFFGMIWGIIGMFLATPIVALTKIVLERIDLTKPVGRILASGET